MSFRALAVQWAARVILGAGSIVLLALILGFTPWLWLVFLGLGGALVAFYLHRLET